MSTRLLEPFRDYTVAPTDMQPHLPRLRALVVEVGAQVIVELGTRWGYSTAALVYGAHDTNGHVWAVDIEFGAPFTDERLTFIQGDDRDAMTAALVPQDIDLLFIDTTHTFLQTAWELERYGTRVREGGLVVAHDTCMDGVAYPLRAFMREHGVAYREWPESYGLGVVKIGRY